MPPEPPHSRTCTAPVEEQEQLEVRRQKSLFTDTVSNYVSRKNRSPSRITFNVFVHHRGPAVTPVSAEGFGNNLSLF